MVKCIAGLGGGSKSLTSRSRSSGCSFVARGVARALYPPHHALRHPSPAMVWLCVSAGGLLVHVCHRQSVRLPVRVCLEFDVLSRGLCRARASSLSACPRYRALWTARCSLGRVTISHPLYAFVLTCGPGRDCARPRTMAITPTHLQLSLRCPICVSADPTSCQPGYLSAERRAPAHDLLGCRSPSPSKFAGKREEVRGVGRRNPVCEEG